MSKPPPKYKPARPFLEVVESSQAATGWVWYLMLPAGAGHLILASNIGTSRCETREEAVANYEAFRQIVNDTDAPEAPEVHAAEDAPAASGSGA